MTGETGQFFKYDPKNIAVIKLTFPDDPQNGFIIKQSHNGSLSLFNSSMQPVDGWDTGYVISYLDRFRKIDFEMWETSKSTAFIDSVRNSTPLEIYSVIDILAGQHTTLKTFLKPLKNGIDLDGKPIDNDQDRMYALIDDKHFVIIQYFVFDPLNHPIAYFYSN